MFKSFKALLNSIKVSHSFLKKNGDDIHDILKGDNSSEFEAWLIISLENAIRYSLPSLSIELQEQLQKTWNQSKKDAMENITEEGIPTPFKSAKQALSTLSAEWEDQNVIWWQGYLAGFSDSNVTVRKLLDSNIAEAKEVLSK